MCEYVNDLVVDYLDQLDQKKCHDPKPGALECRVVSNKHLIHIHKSNQYWHNNSAIYLNKSSPLIKV